MQLHGGFRALRVQGLAGLAGTGVAMTLRNNERWANAVNECFAAPWPTATAPRPPDSLLVESPIDYLSTCVTNADWEGVARCYAYQLDDVLQQTNNPTAFWGLSVRNVQNF